MGDCVASISLKVIGRVATGVMAVLILGMLVAGLI
jgi:hypothetical protein